MRFTQEDELLGMHVVTEGADVLVATGGGYAKRTPADQYPIKGRGGLGVVTARIVEARGELIGALMVHPDDEVFAITSAGGVIRTRAAEIKMSGRQTMGVRLVNLGEGQTLSAIARNAEPLGNGAAVAVDAELMAQDAVEADSAEDVADNSGVDDGGPEGEID
jgi:DNA gyrase subunit A